MKYLNVGGGIDTQPSYRLHHIGTGPGLEEGVDGEPLTEERVGSVPELIKMQSDAFCQRIQDYSPTLGVQHSRTDVRLHAVFILATLPLFARIVA